MKNILVIGGSYFAGRVCVEELTRRADLAVYIFNRGRQPLNMPGVTELRGDRENREHIRAAIPPCEWDAVIDFCAYTPVHVETLLEHLPGTVKQYIFISTTTVLQKSSTLPITEDGPTLTGPQNDLGDYSDYGYNKLLAEHAVERICAQKKIASTILRPAIIYGYYNYAPRESYFFDLIRHRQPIILPEDDLALFSFIWVVDMAHMIIQCIGDHRTHAQTFNLASDELVSYTRIIQVLEEITGKKISPIRMSIREIVHQGIPLPFPLSEHLLYSGAKIRRLLDFSCTPLKKGMREALKYYLLTQQQLNKR